MVQSNWNIEKIADQTGRVIIVTGATSGLGKEISKVLALKNATIVMAIRNMSKGKEVIRQIKTESGNDKLEIMELDLSSLKSIHQFVNNFTAKYSKLDILINNAGVMVCPYSTTSDGFEIQMGTNHLGPFALTGLLLPLLLATPNSRIVSTSSIAHKMGNIDIEDINWEKRKYNTGNAYGASKLANLLFTYELARKLKHLANAPLVTVAHPGAAITELQRHNKLGLYLANIIGQSAEMGALPTLRAAFDPTAQSADFFGPSKFMEIKGYPQKVKSSDRSHNEELAHKLWEVSENLTQIKYTL